MMAPTVQYLIRLVEIHRFVDKTNPKGETMRRQNKVPWKPSEEVIAASTEDVSLVPKEQPSTNVHVPGNAEDPSLEKVIQSMVKLGGSRYATARAQRFTHRHLTTKAKAKKKLQRHQRR